MVNNRGASLCHIADLWEQLVFVRKLGSPVADSRRAGERAPTLEPGDALTFFWDIAAAISVTLIFWLPFRRAQPEHWAVGLLYGLSALVFGFALLGLFSETAPSSFPPFVLPLTTAMTPGVLAILAGFGYRRFFKVSGPFAGLFLVSLVGAAAKDWPGVPDAFWLVPKIAGLGFLLHAFSSYWAGRRDDMDLRRRRSRFLLTGLCGLALLTFLLSPLGGDGVIIALTLLAVLTLFSILYADRPPRDVSFPDYEDKYRQFRRLFGKRRLYREDDLTLERIGDRLLLDNTQMRYLIHRGTGYRRLSDMLDEYRIEAAQAILSDIEEAQTSLEDVAIAVGYGTRLPFEAAFERLTGERAAVFRAARLSELEANRPLHLTNSDR